MPPKVEISHRTILFTFGTVFSVWVLYQIRDIIMLLFVAFLVTTALRPLVDGLTKLRIPLFLSAFLVYFLLFGIIGFSLGSSMPAMIIQVTKLVEILPTYIAKLMPEIQFDAQAVVDQIAPISQNIVGFTVSIFSNVLSLFTVLVFSFYLLVERKQLPQYLLSSIGQEATRHVLLAIVLVETKLGAWVRGQVLLMAIIGLLTYIGLTILRVDYALPLALLAGLLEVVPVVGPIFSAVPAVIIALSVSPVFALIIAVLYFVIQQLENHLIVPFVMRSSVGLSPIVTICALMIGARFEGIVGAIMAVPLVLVGQVLLTFLLETRAHKEEKERTKK